MNKSWEVFVPFLPRRREKTCRDFPLPFDIEVDPVISSESQQDNDMLADAIDESFVWIYPRSPLKSVTSTSEHVLASYRRPHPDTYVDQTLKLLDCQRKDLDSLAINRSLFKLMDYIHDGLSILLHPVRSPIYPKVLRHVCFTSGLHVLNGQRKLTLKSKKFVWALAWNMYGELP